MTRQQFSTGAVRDEQGDKLRYDLIYQGFLRDVAEILRAGAIKYGPNNWQKGFPKYRIIGSLLRHVYAYINNERGEDHLAQAACNLMMLSYMEHQVSAGNKEMESIFYQGEVK